MTEYYQLYTVPEYTSDELEQLYQEGEQRLINMSDQQLSDLPKTGHMTPDEIRQGIRDNDLGQEGKFQLCLVCWCQNCECTIPYSLNGQVYYP